MTALNNFTLPEGKKTKNLTKSRAIIFLKERKVYSGDSPQTECGAAQKTKRPTRLCFKQPLFLLSLTDDLAESLLSLYQPALPGTGPGREGTGPRETQAGLSTSAVLLQPFLHWRR